MKFNIEILSEEYPGLQPGEKANYGLLQIGSYIERFYIYLNFWDISDYENHWRDSIKRIIDDKQKSALITCMYDPRYSNFIFWRPMYKIGTNIIFHDHLLFMDSILDEFDPNNPYKHIPDREIVNEDGEKISEWVLPIIELEKFYNARYKT